MLKPCDVCAVKWMPIRNKCISPVPKLLLVVVSLDPGGNLFSLSNVHCRQVVVRSFGGSRKDVNTRLAQLNAISHSRPVKSRKSYAHTSPVQTLDNFYPAWIAV